MWAIGGPGIEVTSRTSPGRFRRGLGEPKRSGRVPNQFYKLNWLLTYRTGQKWRFPPPNCRQVSSGGGGTGGRGEGWASLAHVWSRGLKKCSFRNRFKTNSLRAVSFGYLDGLVHRKSVRFEIASKRTVLGR